MKAHRPCIPCLIIALIFGASSCDSPNSVPTPDVGRVVTTGLIAYYLFNGDAADSSGHHNDGKMYGTVPARGVYGDADHALHFDGAGARVELPDSLIQKNRTLTVTLWFRTDSTGVLFGYQSVAYPEFPPPQYVPAMYVGSDGKGRAEYWNGDDDPLVTPRSVNDGAWHFMALVGEDTVQRLIVDNLLVASMAGSINHLGMIKNQIGVGNTGVNNALGWPGGNDRWFGFEGEIDNVRLYDRALSLSECDTLYRFKK